MSDIYISAPKFNFGAAVTQIFNLPGGKGYLFRVVGFATVLLTLAFVLLGIPIIKAYVNMFQTMAEMEMSSGMSEAEEMQMALAAMQPIFAAMGWFTLLYVLQIGTFVSVETALYRNIIRGEDKGFFPLRFGGDEFKVLVTRIVVAIIIYAVFFVVYFGLAIVGLIGFGIGSSLESGVMIVVMGIISFALFIVMIGVVIYVSIRLAPSAAFSVRDVDFTPVGSWGAMKSYFWPTFGAILVIGILGYIGIGILALIAFGILFHKSGIFPLLMSMDESKMPDFTPLLDSLTSTGFVIPAFLITVIFVFLGFLYMGAIWSVWGYVAKLTDLRSNLDHNE